MFEVKKTDAFALVARTLDAGNYQTANEMLRIIIDSMLLEKKTASRTLKIEKKNKALFSEIIEER